MILLHSYYFVPALALTERQALNHRPAPLNSPSRHTNAPYLPYSYTQVQVQAAKDIIEANRDVIVGVGCTPAR